MSEVQEVNLASSPTHSSQQADRRVSLIFGQDLPDSTSDPTGDTVGHELLPQGPQNASPSTPHATEGTIGLELLEQGPQTASPSTPHATEGTIRLELLEQGPQNASPPTPHPTEGTTGLELLKQGPQSASQFTTEGTIGFKLAPQGPQSASPYIPHATGSITGLWLPPQRPQDASPPTPPAIEDASERERLIQEIHELYPLQSPIACSDPPHPGHCVTGHDEMPPRQVDNTDNNCIPQSNDASEDQ